MKRTTFTLISLLCLNFALSVSQTKFYNYYDTGVEFIDKGDWQRAIQEFGSAASLEFEDAKMKRTYGTRFIKYFPHREMGVAYYNLGEWENARRELDLSMAYVSTSRAEEYLNLVKNRTPPSLAADARKSREEEAERERQDRERAEREKREADKRLTGTRVTPTTLPVGALTYDPSRVTQVGSRLALAVLPFEARGQAHKYVEAATDWMVAQLVNLRRFKVIERSALDEVLKEQKFQASGIVDERTAVQIGRVAGADAIIFGNISIIESTTKVSARVIDTESGETIVAKDERAQRADYEDIEKMVRDVAITIYNELPIVEGYVISKDKGTMYVDVGTEKGVRKGSKCVAFREGDKILHPKTGELLGRRVTKVGELQVIEVQNRVAEVKAVVREPGQQVEVGDKIVVK